MEAYSNTLVLDIETVASHPSYEDMPLSFQKLWDKKSVNIKNEEGLLPAELYYKRAGIYAEFGKIVCISVGFFHQENDKWQFRVKSLASRNEKEVLEQLNEVFSHFDQSRLRLVAHNGKEFDFPYICRRMLVNGVPIPKVLDIAGKKPWEVHHYDTMEQWKFGDRKSFTSLELLANLFNIKSSKEDIDGSMVNEVYYKEDDLERISVYCKNDVLVTAQLFLKFNNLPLLEEEQVLML